MKAVIMSAMCALVFVSCVKNEPVKVVNNDAVRGRWESVSENCNGERVLNGYVFGIDTYVNDTYVYGEYVDTYVYVNGRYEMNDGKMYLYDRDVDGIVYHEPIAYDVIIEEGKMYLMRNGFMEIYNKQ